MLFKIKNKIDRELSRHIRRLEKILPFKKISPTAYDEIRSFALSKGKRLRPILFITGYLGYAKKPRAGLYATAASFELLHDFLIIHDDIIDRSDIRRGLPSVHARFSGLLAGYKDARPTGKDLAMIVGDMLFGMAVHAFLSIKEDPARKEGALRRLIETAVSTCLGEFGELFVGMKDIKAVSQDEIYRIYDLKTALYSFAGPLCTGAMLAGADPREVARLKSAAVYLGRAFQIRDDILGIFGEEKDTGKSSLSDLKEGKKTILVWYAYHNSDKNDKKEIRRIFSKSRIKRPDLLRMREILVSSGALDYAKGQAAALLKKADRGLDRSAMSPKYKAFLRDFSRELLSIRHTWPRP